MAFEIGDVVVLKSGGPRMTVKSYSSVKENEVYCIWFAETSLEGGTFDDRTLDYSESDGKLPGA